MRNRPKAPSPALQDWYDSDRLRAVARRAARLGLVAQAERPICGAAAKSTGQPCQRPAMANGRCRYHGGLTPKGDQWHKRQFSAGRTAGGTDRLERKLFDLDRAARARAKKLAAMMAEQRSAYDKWQADHDPNPRRRAERLRSKQDAKAALKMHAEILRRIAVREDVTALPTLYSEGIFA